MIRAASLAACILLGIGCQRDAFFCDTPEDCTSEDGGGSCESTGYCSFPDPECDTGRRYGDLAPSGLAGTCVPQIADTEGPSGTESSTSTSTGVSDPTLGESTSSSTSSPATTGSSSDDSTGANDESSSTGETPTCCDASCSTCGESCAPEVLDSTNRGEALAVAVVGTTLVWTTGFTREAFTVDLTTGERTLLATTEQALTNIAVDDEHLYYLSYASGQVRRISLTTGAQSVVADANDERTGLEFEAGFGQIVLDDSDVYFALANPQEGASGGAFRAPKEPAPDQSPERIGTVQRPIGIGVDEDSIYVSDLAQEALLRFDKEAPDPGGAEMLPLALPGPILVTEADVYATSFGQVTRVPKDGSPPTQLTDANGEIRGITGDEAHVYVTDYQSGSVTRISTFDTEPPLQIATSSNPWGIAIDCGHVYWCENGSLSVLRQPK